MNELRPTNYLTPEALAAWSAPYLAYIKPFSIDSQEVFAICAADGTQLGVCQTREVAFVAARQHDLDPHSVH
ncbi:MAG: DUF1150 family protein [Proteobacteria bacterium]|nr:DUF1150 family protein [Pseudomonadota bacterium]